MLWKVPGKSGNAADHTFSLVNLDRVELGASLRKVLFGLGAVTGDFNDKHDKQENAVNDRLPFNSETPQEHVARSSPIENFRVNQVLGQRTGSRCRKRPENSERRAKETRYVRAEIVMSSIMTRAEVSGLRAANKIEFNDEPERCYQRSAFARWRETRILWRPW
jgi:hypothetical protein